MASPAWSLLVLALVFTTINGCFATRHLLDTATAAPEAAPMTPKPTIPSIPTALLPMSSIPKVTIPTTIPTIPTALPPMSSIPNIPAMPTVPTTLPPIPAIPSNIPSIPTTMPKIPVFQMPPIPSPPSTISP